MQNINMTNKLSTVRGIDQRPCFLNSNVPAIPKTKKDRKGKTTKNNIIGLKKLIIITLDITVITITRKETDHQHLSLSSVFVTMTSGISML
ncbi:hypothetical protein [Bacillus inaquosorum]|nr:hypothetical protein [Bacillus inaquosorum]MCY9341215.1 hypothetical protein [Bacillus inaquosorum]MEC0519677.1 hypothetical protein [Bacillus inaquosorum]